MTKRIPKHEHKQNSYGYKYNNDSNRVNANKQFRQIRFELKQEINCDHFIVNYNKLFKYIGSCILDGTKIYNISFCLECKDRGVLYCQTKN